MKYYRPDSLDAYFKLNKKLAGKDVVYLAGGTDLMPGYERGVPLPDHLIDLKQLSTLSSITVGEDYLEIGALTSVQDLYNHAVIQAEFTALYQAAHEFAGAQIRHRGTIGGNICNASPAGDLLPSLYAFKADLVLVGIAGKRTMPISEFIPGPGETSLKDGELLSTIILPRRNLSSQFQKVGLRQSMAISVVNFASVYKSTDSKIDQLIIAAGAVAPTIIYLDDFCGAYLKDPDSIIDHLELIDDAISPIDDIRATANYRRTVLRNLIKDFLKR